MLVFGSLNSRYPSGTQTGPSVKRKPSASFSITASRGTIASMAGSTRVTRAGVSGPDVAPGLKKSSVAERTQMKFDGGSDSGPFTPRIAS